MRHAQIARSFASVWVSAFLVACGPGPIRPVPALAHPRAQTDGPQNARAILEGAAARASQAGAGPLTLVASAIGSEGERVGAFVEVPKNGCLLITAAGSSGVGDVDLFAFDDDGSAAGADESPAGTAAVMICPPHPDRLYVTARIVSGGGVASIGAQEVPVDKVRAVATAVGARGGSDDTGRLDSWPGLEAKVREHRSQLGSHWDDVRRLAAPLDPRAATRTTITIEPHRCVDVLVTPSDEISSLEVVAETPDGRIAARAVSQGRDRSMVLCSDTGESLTLAMRPRVAQGLAAIIIGRSSPGAEAELSRTVRIDRTSQGLPLAEALRAFDAELASATGYGPPKGMGRGQAKVGSRVGLDLKLPQGCARIDVVAGAPLGPVRASLWDDRGALVSEGEGGLRATLFACGASTSGRVDVEAQARPGPFEVELRPFKTPSPALVAHPLAAGRLLERLDAEDSELTEMASLRVVQLAHSSLAKQALTIKENTCREVFVSLDGQGSGIELRLVDDVTKVDSIVRARFTVSDRVCAGPLPKQVTAELRLATGDGAALLLTREVSSD